MEWINYHHLLYFWTVAREGSMARAAQVLHRSQPTLSGQIRLLEESIGRKLFRKAGRRLALTDEGRLVYRYADEIYTTGRELRDVLQGRPVGRPARLAVGVTDAIPKLVAERLLRPALKLREPLRLVCREGEPDVLLGALAQHELDVVFSDRPAPGGPVKAFTHPLAESPVGVYGAPRLAAKHRRRFPKSLDGAPFLLPLDSSALRRSVEQWFDARSLGLRVVGEIEDGALLKAFGRSGMGLFAAPDLIRAELRQHYGCVPVGRLAGVKERYFALTVERRLQHPGVAALTAGGR
jgi:LysR family transcriptional activator of nhaA